MYFLLHKGQGQRIAACPRGRSSTFPPTAAMTESRGDDMYGKQSSKNGLKKRLLKRRQAMTKRWDKQSTRRHLPVYLLCNLLLVGSLYGCIFAIPNVRDVRTVRTKITDVHYEAVRWAQWIAFTTPDGERFFLRRDWRGYDAAREDTARLQALAAGGTELELTVSGHRFSFLDMHSGEQQVVGVRAEQETFLPVSEWVADVCRSRVTDSVLLGVYAVITLGGLLYLLLLCKT